jgi:hypothetical protein
MSGMRGVSSIALLGGAAARSARYRRQCRQISASGLGRPASAVCRGPAVIGFDLLLRPVRNLERDPWLEVMQSSQHT